MDIASEWREMCEALQQVAEGYAATDGAFAWRYREEVAEFCALEPPADAENLALRDAEAEAIRLRWSGRLRRAD